MRATLAILLCGMAIAPALRADGMKFPEKAVPRLPAIPKQRALISWHDGVERLVIESSLIGEGQRFGWVIPLPAAPTHFEKETPGLLHTLSRNLQPEVVHDRSRVKDSWVLIASLILYWLLFRLVTGSRYHTTTEIAGLIPILLVSLYLWIPDLQSSFGVAGDAIVERRVSVGSYDLTVLNAADPAELDAWLASNGFREIPAGGEAVVRDYIARGWRFVAAEIRRDEERGLAHPHPLAMSFPVAQPIYPMRLTALAGSDVYLELFVVADMGVTAPPGLRVDVAGVCEYAMLSERGARVVPAISVSGIEIGHPDARRSLREGAFLTRLSGTLTPADMREDIQLAFAPRAAAQRLVYSPQGARHTAVIAGSIAWCLAVFAMFLLAIRRLQAGWNRRFLLGRIIAPALLVALASAGVCWLLTPSESVDVLPSQRGRFGGEAAIGRMASQVKTILETMPLERLPPEEIARRIESHYAQKGQRSWISGGSARVGDSPGDFAILRDERGLVLRVYLANGQPMDEEL